MIDKIMKATENLNPSVFKPRKTGSTWDNNTSQWIRDKILMTLIDYNFSEAGDVPGTIALTRNFSDIIGNVCAQPVQAYLDHAEENTMKTIEISEGQHGYEMIAKNMRSYMTQQLTVIIGVHETQTVIFTAFPGPKMPVSDQSMLKDGKIDINGTVKGIL